MTIQELAFKLVKSKCKHDYTTGAHCPACAVELLRPIWEIAEDAIEFSTAFVPGHIAQARCRLDMRVSEYMERGKE